MSARLLVRILREPAGASWLSTDEWNALIAAARSERLIGALAHRLRKVRIPAPVAPILTDALLDTAREKQQALWEADRMQAALAPLGVPVLLLKGTAYVAAELQAGEGRFIGDLDILVPRAALPAVEAALFKAGWEWVKPDPYDDHYYRQWMHELPPMIHRERDRMIDVHHTILPLTARPTPDVDAMIRDSVALDSGVRILAPIDMVCHSAAHMLADGDLTGGLRNLWDIHCLLQEFHRDPAFRAKLKARAKWHGLGPHVARAARLADHFYGSHAKTLGVFDRIVAARLLARDGWGRETSVDLRAAFFVRSHWMRMPPLMLARHLYTKWRMGHRPA